jgi:hypothetical protein
MVQVHTCVSVHCGQCGASPAGFGFEAHYPTEDAALDGAAAAGWVVGPGGRLWCSACGPVLECEADGHQFSPWRQGETERGLPGGSEYRYCRRCCLHESRAAALLVGGSPGRGKTSAMQLLLAAGIAGAGEVA